MNVSTPIRLTSVVLAAGLATACNGKTKQDDDGYSCVRDEALLAEPRDCFEDDDCPCGSHCALGECISACASDDECGAGFECDPFGRCLDEDAPLAGPDPADQGAIVVDHNRIHLPADGETRRIGLTATGRASGPVRVAAPGGVEVSCDAGASFGPQCRLDAVVPGAQPLPVHVRAADAGGGSAEQGDVRVFAGSQRIAVSVRFEQPEGAGSPQRPLGLYEGFAWPVLAGSRSRTHVDELPSEMEDLRLPLRFEVFAGSDTMHPVRIVDEFGVLFPAGEVGAELVYGDDGRWRLHLPAWHLVGPQSPATDEVEVWVPETLADSTWNDQRITAEIETAFEGATTIDYTPFLRWTMTASWSADLAAGATAPGLDPNYQPVFEAQRGAAALPIEPLVRSALGPDLDVLTLDGTPSQWAQATACTLAGNGEPTFMAPTILQLDGADAPAGDLACGEAGGTYPAPTFGLLTSNLLQVNENVRICLDDLGQVALAVEQGDPDAPLASDGCMAAGRIIAALGHATEEDRSRALGEARAPDFEASAIGARLVQQWLDSHAFMAREADRVQQLNDILDPQAEEGGPVDQGFTVPEAVTAAVAGWDLLLHPRFGIPLAATPTQVLVDPDYRDRLHPAETYPDRHSYTQSVGVAASMLDALGIELRVMTSLVGQAQRGLIDREQVDTLVGELFRRTAVVVSLAHALHTAASGTAEPGWEAHWNSSRQGVASATRELIAAVEAMRAGQNPLGIEDTDLPLYRVGDQETATQRFSALSDFLLGTTDDGVAQFMVQRAEAELQSAREAWFANVERDVSAELEGQERERRLEAINSQFGGVITSLCGNPDWNAATVLEIWDQVDPESCYLTPTCDPNVDEVRQRITAADIGRSLCIATRLRRRFGPAVATADGELDGLLTDMANFFLGRRGFPFSVVGVAERGTDIEVFIRDTSGSFNGTISMDALADLKVRLPEGTDPQVISDVTVRCDAMAEATDARRPDNAPASCGFADDCPTGDMCAEGTCAPDPENALTDRPECYRGALGSQALAVRSAGREVAAARSHLSEFSDKYDIAMRSCIITQLAREDVREATLRHDTVMAIMGGAKLAADIVSSTAETAMAAASAAAPWDKVSASIVGGVKIVADIASLGLEFAMTTITDGHERNIQQITDLADDQRCFNDAEMELVGVRTAIVRVQQASIDLSREMLEFENGKAQVRSAAVEGHQALEAELGRRATPITTDFWLSEDVDRYRRFLRQARRTAYLAVLATEYEFQFTSMARMDTLAAQTPAQLQAVIDELRAYSLTGTVGGGAPSDRLTVVSLRDHLIQMADHSEFPDGWHQLSAGERFKVLLTSKSYARYDEAGVYLGQEIPFTIVPLGSLGLGDSQGIPVLAGTDCAERLWSVNASVLGEDLYRGSDTTFSTVVLRKRNTFFSQWCAMPEAMDPFQVASTRPTRNLFLDPLDFEGSQTTATPMPDANATDEINAFTDARISAHFNVPRAELEDEEYFNGDSQELAARGLFGDYALFFPAETLDLDERGGLHLDNIEDILLRLDYVSVAQ